ncbi:MAG: class I SAM-dependent methyltransferase, partial [Oscillospiraceae bacterium]
LEMPTSYCEYTIEKYKKLSGAHITVFDISKQSVDKAKQCFEQEGLQCVEYGVGDTGRLKYADNTFDLVVCFNGMNTFSDNSSAFLEISRVLKKGGQFCGTMYLKNQNAITDFVVSMIHVNKGSLTPPFYKKKEIEKMFGKNFSKVEIIGEKAIVCFNCIK